jgi:hypothetical protein
MIDLKRPRDFIEETRSLLEPREPFPVGLLNCSGILIPVEGYPYGSYMEKPWMVQ